MRNGLVKNQRFGFIISLYLCIIRMFGDISLKCQKMHVKKMMYLKTNDQKEQYSHFLINLTFDAIKNDHDPEEKIELSKFVSEFFQRKRKIIFQRLLNQWAKSETPL